MGINERYMGVWTAWLIMENGEVEAMSFNGFSDEADGCESGADFIFNRVGLPVPEGVNLENVEVEIEFNDLDFDDDYYF